MDTTGAKDTLRDRLQAVLKDSFQIERLLGRGGMGSVYALRPALAEPFFLWLLGANAASDRVGPAGTRLSPILNGECDPQP